MTALVLMSACSPETKTVYVEKEKNIPSSPTLPATSDSQPVDPISISVEKFELIIEEGISFSVKGGKPPYTLNCSGGLEKTYFDETQSGFVQRCWAKDSGVGIISVKDGNGNEARELVQIVDKLQIEITSRENDLHALNPLKNNFFSLGRIQLLPRSRGQVRGLGGTPPYTFSLRADPVDSNFELDPKSGEFVVGIQPSQIAFIVTDAKGRSVSTNTKSYRSDSEEARFSTTINPGERDFRYDYKKNIDLHRHDIFRLLPDDAVIVGGTLDSNSSYFAKTIWLKKLTKTGEIDEKFGVGGISELTQRAYSILDLQTYPDGSLLIGLEVLEPSTKFAGKYDGKILLLKLLADASMDPSFGQQGVLPLSNDENFLTGRDNFQILMQEDGFLISSFFFNRDDVENTHGPLSMEKARSGVIKFCTDGSVDKSFGKNGLVELPLKLPYRGFSDSVKPLALQKINGEYKVVVTGSDGAAYGSQLIRTVRLNPNGSLDESFSNNGIFELDFKHHPAGDSYPVQSGKNIYVLQNGTIAVTGTSSGAPFFLLLSAEGKLTSKQLFVGPDHAWHPGSYRVAGPYLVEIEPSRLALFATASSMKRSEDTSIYTLDLSTNYPYWKTPWESRGFRIDTARSRDRDRHIFSLSSIDQQPISLSDGRLLTLTYFGVYAYSPFLDRMNP